MPLVVGRAGFPETCLDAESMPTTLNTKSWPHNDSIRRNSTICRALRDVPGNLRYIALNSVDHPASLVLRESKLWIPYRRTIEIPDMVAVRKADFVRLFTTLGVPLESRELECLSHADLVACATDLRSYILERNRHVVFCKACGKKMLHLNTQVMASQSEHIC
jgi:hypothetical protein